MQRLFSAEFAVGKGDHQINEVLDDTEDAIDDDFNPGDGGVEERETPRKQVAGE